jgi:hypothetical protein
LIGVLSIHYPLATVILARRSARNLYDYAQVPRFSFPH